MSIISFLTARNTYLKTLEIAGYSSNPTFVKNYNGPYRVTVPSSLGTVLINAEPEVASTTVEGNTAQSLVTGSNVFEIKTTSESGDTRLYSMIVTKEKDALLWETGQV